MQLTEADQVTREQFKNLFDLYFDNIRSYLYYRCGDVHISTDLAQDTFMRIWEKNMELNPEKDVALLYKIAGDLFISHYRRERLRDRLPKEIRFEQGTSTPEEELQLKELQDTYEKVLAELPENQRVTFLMSRVEGLTYREIAERLSLSVKAVEKRVSGALARLRKEIMT